MEVYTWIVESRRKLLMALAAVVVVSLVPALSWFGPPQGWIAWEYPVLAPTDSPRVDQWCQAEREKTLFCLGLDFLFLVAYPLLTSLLCSHAARAWNAPAWLARLCRAAAVWVWVAVPLDAAENVGLMMQLWGWRDRGLDIAISATAGLKWFAALSALGVFTVAVVAALYLWVVEDQTNAQRPRSGRRCVAVPLVGAARPSGAGMTCPAAGGWGSTTELKSHLVERGRLPVP